MHYSVTHILSWLALPKCQLTDFLDSSNRFHSGIISSIERESGNGKTFNVYYHDQASGKKLSAFVRAY